MMNESAVLCESEKMLNDNQYAEAVLELEFGSGNLEGDVSNPSFSTDVSDEEGTVFKVFMASHRQRQSIFFTDC